MQYSDIIQAILVFSLVLITGYYAFQTRRQANLLNNQLNNIIEQRQKSIRPSLQLSHVSYKPRISKMPDTHKQILIPDIELYISNVGSGPALDLTISASATINVTRGNIFEGNVCRLYWKLMEASKESYLPHTLDPVSFHLNLVQVDKISLKELNREMHIRFNLKDIDRSPFTDLKTVYIDASISPLDLKSYESCSIPGDPDYPPNITISI